jgi:hypothetical protein
LFGLPDLIWAVKVGVFADDVARDLGILEVRDAPLICP